MFDLLRNEEESQINLYYPGVTASISSNDIKICTHGTFRLTTIGSRPSSSGSQYSSFLDKGKTIQFIVINVFKAKKKEKRIQMDYVL